MKRILIGLTACICVMCGKAAPPETSYDILQQFDGGVPPQDMVFRETARTMQLCAQERWETIRRLNSAAEWRAHQAYIRRIIDEETGPMPSRSPLNAELMGVIQRPDYTIEKVIFESLPGFHVTANVYVPHGLNNRTPAVLHLCGHEVGAKANETDQTRAAGMAKRGYVSMIIDPIGQGERGQYLPYLQGSKGSTEHNLASISCQLLGFNFAMYCIWDGMRAIDYLHSRPDVDPTRLVVTGGSGGGTMTHYLAGLDARVTVAAPALYTNSWQIRLDAGLSTEGEQIFPNSLKHGVDNRSDFQFLIAPRPLLIAATHWDPLNPLTGVHLVYQQAHAMYAALGRADALDIVISPDGHRYNRDLREGLYRWADTWLQHAGGSSTEQPYTVEDAATLNCTISGQVAPEKQGRTIMDLIRERAETVTASIAFPKSGGDAEVFRRTVKERITTLLGLEELPDAGVLTGKTTQSSGYTQKDFALQTGVYVRVPVILLEPPDAQGLTILVHDKGKAYFLKKSSLAQSLVNQHQAVALADLRTFGETVAPKDNVSAIYSLMLGQPMIGRQVQDIRQIIRRMPAMMNTSDLPVTVVGYGDAAVPALIGSLLEPAVDRVVAAGAPVSWRHIATADIHAFTWEQLIPDVMKFLDLPHIAAAFAPRPLLMLNPVDAMRAPLPAGDCRSVYAQALAVNGALEIQTVQETETDKFIAVFRTYP